MSVSRYIVCPSAVRSEREGKGSGMGKSRFLGACVVLSVTLLAGVALAESADGSRFSDDDGNTHEVSIEAIASEGITKGCNRRQTLDTAQVTL